MNYSIGSNRATRMALRLFASFCLICILPLVVNGQASVTPIALEGCGTTMESYTLTYGSYSIYQVAATFNPNGSGSLSDNGSGNFDITWTSEGTATLTFAYYDGAIPTTYTGVAPLTTYANFSPGTLTTSASDIEYESSVTLSMTGGSGTRIYQKCTSGCSTTTDTGWSTTTATQSNLTGTTKYRIKSTACGVQYSGIKTVTVYPEFFAGSISGPSSVCSGADIELSSGLDADGGKGTITYQWEHSTDGVSWSDVSWNTADQATLQNVPIGDQWRKYRRRASSEFNEDLVTSTIDLDQINVVSVVSAGSLDPQTICYGATPGTITGTPASNGGGTYTYYWSFSNDNGANWSTEVNTGTSHEFIDVASHLSDLTSDYKVRRRVVESGCGTQDETDMTINVRSLWSVGTLSTPARPEYNTSLTLQISGNTGAVKYYKSSDNANWEELTSSSSGNLTSLTYFKARLNSTTCGELYSNTVSITPYDQFFVGSISGPSSVCSGADIELSSGLDADGGKGTITYQWEHSTDGVSWSDVSWNTAGQATLQNVPIGGQWRKYRRRASSEFNEDLVTSTIDLDQITVESVVSAGSLDPQTICYGATPGTITGTPASNGGGTYTYYWSFSNDNGANWSTEVNTGTSHELIDVASHLSDLTSDYKVRRRVVESGCGTQDEAEMTINVRSLWSAGTLSTPARPEYNTSLTLQISGNTGAVKYYKSADNANWEELTSSNSGNLTSLTYFKARLSSTTCGELYSNTVSTTPYDEFFAGTISGPSSACSAADIELSSGLDAEGGKGTITYQWEHSTDGVSWSDVSWNTADQATLQNVPIGGTWRKYRRLASSDFDENLPSSIIDLDNINVYSSLNAGTLGPAQTHCQGSTARIIEGTSPTGSGGVYTYSWDIADNASYINAVSISGNADFTEVSTYLNNLQTTMYVRRNVTSTTCSVTDYSEVIITVLPSTTPVCTFNGTGVIDNPATGTLMYNTIAELPVTWANFPQLEGADLYYEIGGNEFLISADIPTGANVNVSYDWQIDPIPEEEFSLVAKDHSQLINFRSDELEFVDPIEVQGLISGKYMHLENTPLHIYWTGGSELWTFDFEIFQEGVEIPVFAIYDTENRLVNQFIELEEGLNYTLRITQKNLEEEIVIEVEECVSNYASQNQNFVIDYTARNVESVCLTNGDPILVQESISYMDGLGRPLQSVTRNASNMVNYDLITHYSYDDFGRADKAWLPYAKINGYGRFQDQAETDQIAYYETIYPSDKDFAFSEQVFENAPLNRVSKTASPGLNWNKSSGHTVDFEYSLNDASSVKKLYVEDDILNYQETYGAKALYKKVIKDENEGSNEGVTIEYQDRSGRVVLKQVKLSINGASIEYANTYYIYDEFGNLRFVLQPEGERLIEDENEPTVTWASLNDDTFRKNWMFSYEYDQRQRIIRKRVPGSEWVEMVYDDRDRLVLTRDGNRDLSDLNTGVQTLVGNEGYTTPTYKAYGEGSIVLSGNFKYTAVGSNKFEAIALPVPEDRGWIFTKYDELNRPVMTGLLYDHGSREEMQESVADFYESSSNYFEVKVANSETGYSNQSYPNIDENNISLSIEDVLSLTYYDDYSFTTESLPENSTDLVTGQITGTKTRVLGTNVWLNGVSFYDDRYRVIKTIQNNYLNGQDITTFTYYNEISSLITRTESIHTGGENITVIENFAYDHLDRVLKITQQINDGPSVVITSNTYNEIGELVEKNLGGTTSPVQSIDYDYNIRGWLTHINNGTTLDTGENDKFGLQLRYEDSPAGFKQQNGNIGQMEWRSLGGGLQETGQDFKYSYDGSSRLTLADYTGIGNFDVGAIQYDFNGNIRSLQRNTRDNLTYDYGTGFNQSNQLLSVSDAGTTEYFEDGNTSGEDYDYDDNGNLMFDLNKEISSISYNYLNLPELVTFQNGNAISYTYSAAGEKLRKVANISASITTTDYVGGFHFTNNSLTFLRHDEGRAVKDGNIFNYEYNLTDHLGNVRMTVDDSGSVIQRDDYYPFGMTFNSYVQGDKNKYLYNGMEEQEETGWYQPEEFRIYEPSLGRFLMVDPVIKYHESPYAWNTNNPIAFPDPMGSDGDYYTKDGKHLGSDDKDDDKVYVAESVKKDKDGVVTSAENSKDLGVTHTSFATSANVVKHESSGNKEESLWIAHAANNAKDNNAIDYKKQNSTVEDQLTDSQYSTTPSSARKPLGTDKKSASANNARAAVIDVLLGNADPTGGAVLWDGDDFRTKGTSHNKFKEYTSVNIGADHLQNFARGGGSNRKAAAQFVGPIVFKGSFSRKGNSKRYYSLHSTGAPGKGRSIFWKIKK